MPKPIFFFREQAETGFLCQWYPCGFRDEDEDFNCAEQYMMWHKAKAFGDEEAQRAILAAKNPQKQKVLGQKVKGFDQNKWDEVKEHVVEEGNFLKFSMNPHLEKRLLETGERDLAEASPFDRVWGIGYSALEAPRTPREKWGQNLLGKALVRVRERLRVEAEDYKAFKREWMEWTPNAEQNGAAGCGK